ncbi:MAG: TIGR02301 family protein [Parvibaculum sp.]|nr:TIGR02301 family protein [Parvibaculum sp.]
MGRSLSIFGTCRARIAAGLFALALALPSPVAAAFPPKAVQLAEILGAVHHIRDICGANEGQLWRNKMIEMIAVLGPTEAERQRLVKHFNDSYYRYRNAYPKCTATAAGQSDKLMQDGQKIAEELAASGYGR